MSLWGNFRARYSILRANFQLNQPDRSDYGIKCCELDDADVVLIALLLLVTALLAYLLLTATVGSGRKKRELIVLPSNTSNPSMSSGN